MENFIKTVGKKGNSFTVTRYCCPFACTLAKHEAIDHFGCFRNVRLKSGRCRYKWLMSTICHTPLFVDDRYVCFLSLTVKKKNHKKPPKFVWRKHPSFLGENVSRRQVVCLKQTSCVSEVVSCASSDNDQGQTSDKHRHSAKAKEAADSQTCKYLCMWICAH